MSSKTAANLLSYWQSLVLVILPGAVAVIIYFLAYLPLINDQLAERRAEDLARVKAQMLDNNFQQLAQQLDGMARIPSLRQAMRDNDIVSLERLTSDFSLQFSHLDQLALLPLGELGIASLGVHGSKLRNNIEKDIIRRALDNESVLVDTYALAGERVVSLARPVYVGGRSIGAILLTLKTSWLSSQLDGVAVDSDFWRGGVTELVYQSGGAEPVVIVSDYHLAQETVEGAVSQAALVTNSRLKVRYKLSGVPINLRTATILALLVCAAIIICAVIALRILLAKLLRDVAKDAVSLTEFFKEATPNEGPASGFVFSDFNSAAQTISKTLMQKGQTASSPVKPKETEPGNAKVDSDVSAWANPRMGESMLVENLAEDDPSETTNVAVPTHIFRAYDIRGNAEQDLTDDIVHQIGKAIGSTALDSDQPRIIVGRDGRISSERIQTALIEGVLATGCDVIDIGLVATPMLYFAAESLETRAGVMVTGSHNDAEYNGLKVVLNGQALAEDDIQALAGMISDSNFHEGSGLVTEQDIADSYIDQIVEDVVVASPMKVVLDCCNGAASEIAPMLFASLGCEVIPLYAEVDGSFPNHSPDPNYKDNLSVLVQEVKSQQADLGLAFDGDADRVVVVTASGKIVNADQILMLFARDVLTRNPGADVVYDIKCSRHLNQVIASFGGRPVMWKSGHSFVKQKMVETGALLGGEFSGHFFFKERWFGFDDGLYSGARLIEFLTLEGVTLDSLIDELPESYNTPELSIPIADDAKFSIIETLQASADFGEGQVTTLDGVRVDYPEGWGLIRASNTSPSLTLRFEANSPEELESIQEKFQQILVAVDPALVQFR